MSLPDVDFNALSYADGRKLVEKQASIGEIVESIKGAIGPALSSAGTAVSDAASGSADYLKGATTQIMELIRKYPRQILYPAGIIGGGVLGGLSSLGQEEGRRTPLSRILTGAALGGTAVGGADLIYNALQDYNKAEKGIADEAERATAQRGLTSLSKPGTSQSAAAAAAPAEPDPVRHPDQGSTFDVGKRGLQSLTGMSDDPDAARNMPAIGSIVQELEQLIDPESKGHLPTSFGKGPFDPEARSQMIMTGRGPEMTGAITAGLHHVLPTGSVGPTSAIQQRFFPDRPWQRMLADPTMSDEVKKLLGEAHEGQLKMQEAPKPLHGAGMLRPPKRHWLDPRKLTDKLVPHSTRMDNLAKRNIMQGTPIPIPTQRMSVTPSARQAAMTAQKPPIPPMFKMDDAGRNLVRSPGGSGYVGMPPARAQYSAELARARKPSKLRRGAGTGAAFVLGDLLHRGIRDAWSGWSGDSTARQMQQFQALLDD